MKALHAACGLAAAACAGIWWIALAGSREPLLQVVFLDVGQGDAAVARTPGGRVLIVDCGGATPTSDAGRSAVAPWLRRQGIRSVDALALTHADKDHIGGALAVIAAVPARRVLVPAGAPGSPDMDRVLAQAQDRGAVVIPLTRGQVVDFRDGSAAEVLSPAGVPRGSRSPDNDSSLVLRIRYGRTSLLLTGDAELAAESDMVRGLPSLAADVLKAGHHGSLTSTGERFLAAVQPRAAIISVGRSNAFGHPHPLVLRRLEARGIRVFRTDQHGAITVVSNGRALVVRAERPARL